MNLVVASKEDVAWATGIFEGEGCITLTGGKSPLLSMTSTDRDVIHKFSGILGTGVMTGPHYHKTRTHRKPYWRWRVGGSECFQAIICFFWRYFCSRRRRRAAEVLAVCHTAYLSNANKTVCKRGHKFNYYYQGEKVYRRCMTCVYALRRSRYKSKKIGAL